MKKKKKEPYKVNATDLTNYRCTSHITTKLMLNNSGHDEARFPLFIKLSDESSLSIVANANLQRVVQVKSSIH